MIGIAGVVALLFGVGGLIALMRPRLFHARWVGIAAALVVVNDLLLTRGYGLIPGLPGTTWNWVGKALALAATLAIAALPMFGWRRSGLTLAQQRGSWWRSLPVAILYCLVFLALARLFPSDPAGGETIAFQLTMPGLEEEPFYRGVLLLALDRAFTGRVRWLGVDLGWGAVLSSAMFGLAHAFGYAKGTFAFDPLSFILTAGPALVAVWLRLRTGSVALPILLHNFGNSISLFA